MEVIKKKYESMLKFRPKIRVLLKTKDYTFIFKKWLFCLSSYASFWTLNLKLKDKNYKNHMHNIILI